MTAYERLLARLDGVRRNGAQAMARCPAHEDRKPSLSLRAIEGQSLVYCHAGCGTRDVLAALDLDLPDLYDDPKGASYNYADGRVVHRTPDKRFRQSGRTSAKSTVLYHVEKVFDAIRAGRTVYVVEGEKDVHAIESVGAAATTNPMGSKNWSKVDASPLYGADIIVIPDSDTAGKRWAQDVLATLDGKAKSVLLARPKVGKDVADHIAAGLELDSLEPVAHEVDQDPPAHRVVLTPASSIHPRRVRWAWLGRIALGTLALLAGPEGLGKSTLAYWLGARITRGELPGEYLGQPKAVLVCATEDSWAHTIVPRLMAAGADLDLVYRVEVKTADDITLGLSLPRDLQDLDRAAQQTGAALLILDPLISRISEALDTHRDGDVRRALEPLVGLADHTGMATIGLIHHNKSGSSDPLQLVMASKAFTAVARSVHTVINDPDDETDTRRLFGTPKNNLGRTDLPVMSFTITGWTFTTDDGPASTGQLVWGDDVDGTIAEALRRANDDPENRTAADEAGEWLADYLQAHGPRVPSKDIKTEASRAGHSLDAVKRARRKMKIQVIPEGFPRVTYWLAPEKSPVGAPARGDTLTALTHSTGHNGHQLAQSVQSGDTGTLVLQLCRRCDEPNPQHPRLCDSCITDLARIAEGVGTS